MEEWLALKVRKGSDTDLAVLMPCMVETPMPRGSLGVKKDGGLRLQ